MKKLLLILFTLTLIVIPLQLHAQPKGEGWISLEQILKDKYKFEKSVDRPDWYWGYLSPNGDIFDISVISKLAYKKNVDPKDSRSELHLKKITGINEDEIKYICDPKIIEINNNFDIKIGKEKIKSKKLPKDENGWLIYVINDPAGIMAVTGINGNKVWDDEIFKNIYVYLDPAKNPIPALEEARIEKGRQEIEKRKKQFQEFLSWMYTNPQEKGWTPERTDKLTDGTIVEHYKEGIRFFKKPNGDFVSIIQPEDGRDRDLNLIKGMDREFPLNTLLVGDYQISFPNKVVLKRKGVDEMALFENGDTLIAGLTIYVLFDHDEVARGMVENNYDNLNAFQPTFPIKFYTFLEPEKYLLKSDYLERKFDDKVSGRSYGTNTDHMYEFVEIGSLGYKFKPLTFSYITKDNKNNKTLELKQYRPKDFWSNGNYFTDPFVYWVLMEENNPQLYTLGVNGLEAAGFNGDVNGQASGFNLPSYRAFMVPNEISNFNLNNGTRINFKNGDFYNNNDEYHITLSDGTIIEKFSNKNGRGGLKVTHPNGDFFIPYRDYNLDTYIDASELTYHIFPYAEGTLTKANGKKFEFGNQGGNLTEQNAKDRKEWDALYKKYGKETVLSAAMGGVAIGMPLELLKKVGNPVLESSGTNYAWYRYYHRYIRVNKKTGKIDYIGHKF